MFTRLVRAPLLLVATALLGVPATVRAEKGSPEVNSFYGSAGTSVPIGVPGFHGIEPGLALSHSSTARNGFVGWGWDLAGASTIERASPGKGAPRFDTGDIFLMGGTELVPCTDLGGTHCTKIQSYQRITRNEGADEWYVWAKNGTKQTYAAQFVTANGTYRWALSEVEDTIGNAVQYSYWCDGAAPNTKECYLDNVQYGGVEIELYRETRPDEPTEAVGGQIAQMSYRLKSIDVKVGGSRARAYELTYTASVGLSYSLLASIEQYGKDAMVDGSGTITGGTSLPAATYSYAPEADEAVLQGQSNGPSPLNPGKEQVMADVNGDGKLDIVEAAEGSSGSDYKWCSINVSLASEVPADNGYAEPVLWAQFKERDDYTYSYGSGYYYDRYHFNGCHFDESERQSSSSHSRGNNYYYNYRLAMVVDVNGDGAADLLTRSTASAYPSQPNTTDTFSWLSDGSSFSFQGQISGPSPLNPGDEQVMVDVNGDGKLDIVEAAEGSSGSDYKWCNINVSLASEVPADNGYAEPVLWAQFKERDDYTVYSGGGYYYNRYYYNGCHFDESERHSSSSHSRGNNYYYNYRLAMVVDVNGDGAADLLTRSTASEYPSQPNTTDAFSWLSDGSSFSFQGQISGPSPLNPGDEQVMADVNGDGKLDIVEAAEGSSGSDYKWCNINVSLASEVRADNGYAEPVLWAQFKERDDYTVYSGGGYYYNRYYFNGCHFDESERQSSSSHSRGSNYYYNYRLAMVVDVNGDGAADLLTRSTASAYPSQPNTTDTFSWLSDGSSFSFQGQISGPSPLNPGKKQVMADVNGDGKLDIVEAAEGSSGSDYKWCNINVSLASEVPADNGYAEPVLWAQFKERDDYTKSYSGGYYYDRYYYNGCHFDESERQSSSSHSRGNNYYYNYRLAMVVNVNGDGAADLMTRSTASAYPSQPNTTDTFSWLSGGDSTPSNALATVENGLGGMMEITYAHAPVQSDKGTFTTAVVSSLSVSDGRGNTYITSYEYDGGLYDSIDRHMLGFHYVKKTLPCVSGETTCPYKETWFHQNYGSVSKPEREDVRTGSGVLTHSSQYTYETNGSTVPYTCLGTESWAYVYDDSSSLRTAQTRTFDAYGNVVQEVTYGDYDESGDESTTHKTYVHNTSAFIVDKPAKVQTYGGVGTSGSLIAEEIMYFDGATGWNTPPQNGQVTKALHWLNTTGTYVAVEFEYDAYGNITAQVDSLGNRAETTYDSTYHVFPVTRTNPLSQTVTTQWDAVCGEVVSTTDTNGSTETTTYDALCRVTRKDAPGGGYRIVSYESYGNPSTQHVRVETPGASGYGNVWIKSYTDGLGREWRTEARGPEAGQVVRRDKSLDGRGNAIGETAPHFVGDTPVWTTREYSGRDELVRITHPDDTYITFSYSLSTVTATDEVGNTATKVFDARGNTIERREDLGGGQEAVTSYEFDLRGNPTKTIDPDGNEWITTFDTRKNKISQDDPDLGVWTYEYDAVGNLVAMEDPKGQRTEMTYDALRRTLTKTARAGTPDAETVTWTYDEVRAGYSNIGKLTTMTDAAGQVTCNYDAAGNLVEMTRTMDGSAYTFEHGYDSVGRLLWTEYPNGESVGTAASPREYNEAGLLESIPGYLDELRYEADGNAWKLTNANGTVTTRTFSPDRLWLTSISTVKGSTAIQDLDYTRNAKGQITEIASAFDNESWTYGYDALGQLTSATNLDNSSYSQTFVHSSIGNMTSNSQLGSYSYPSGGSARPHAVLQAGSNTYAYDANGNMTSGAGRTITWNGDNQPVQVNGATFVYDGDGMRIKKVENDTTTITLGDDYEIREGVVTIYVSVGGVVMAKNVSGSKFWLHTDHLGSIQAVSDSSGQEIYRHVYRPYGDDLSTGGAHQESRGYTGQRQDDSGLFYLHARYYDPVLARFISPDPNIPADSVIGLNRYAYALNDGVNHSDVSGLGLFDWANDLWDAATDFVQDVVDTITDTINAVWEYVQPYILPIAVSIAVGCVLGPYGVGLSGMPLALGTGFGTGFCTTLLAGGDFGDAVLCGVMGAITNAAMYQAGVGFDTSSPSNMGTDGWGPAWMHEGSDFMQTLESLSGQLDCMSDFHDGIFAQVPGSIAVTVLKVATVPIFAAWAYGPYLVGMNLAERDNDVLVFAGHAITDPNLDVRMAMVDGYENCMSVSVVDLAQLRQNWQDGDDFARGNATSGMAWEYGGIQWKINGIKFMEDGLFTMWGRMVQPWESSGLSNAIYWGIFDTSGTCRHAGTTDKMFQYH